MFLRIVKIERDFKCRIINNSYSFTVAKFEKALTTNSKL